MIEKIKLIFNATTIEAILIKEDLNSLTIKLKNGYNSILNKSEVKIISREKIKENALKEELKLESKSKLNILLLHTGGTIASKVDYNTGAVSSKFTPNEILNLYSDLLDIANITPKLISNLSSEDMRFGHWNLLLDSIKNEVKNYHGIIISHGTDIMHYSSCALQYAIKNLSIPILLVGAQRSSDRASSDAYSNLKAAINFISYNHNLEHRYNRVGICMHDSISKGNHLILDGINAKKMHSSRRDAFSQINYSPVCRISSEGIKILRKELFTQSSFSKLEIVKFDETLKIGFFKSHPNLDPEEIKLLSFYDIVIIEGTGLGHLAVTEFDDISKINEKNLDELKKLIKKTILIVGVQTVSGQTNLNVYSSGRRLLESGVLGQNMNLTTESLFCRAAYIWSKDKKIFFKLWDENLEGFLLRDIDVNLN